MLYLAFKIENNKNHKHLLMKNLKKPFYLQLNVFKTLIFICFFSFSFIGVAQVNWTNDGDSYFKLEDNQLLTYTLPNHEAKTVISKAQLTPAGKSEPLEVAHFSFSQDQEKILLFTNTKKVWRLHTKGDYWIFNFKTNTLTQIGKSLPRRPNQKFRLLGQPYHC